MLELFGKLSSIYWIYNYSPEKITQFAKERFSCEAVGKTLDETY